MSLRYRLTRWALAKWVTPRLLVNEELCDDPVYVLPNRSTTDLAMLDIAIQQIEAPGPQTPHELGTRHLSLNKPVGLARRQTMRNAPAVLESMLGMPEAATSNSTLVPVVVFWGRAPSREWSFWRSLFSETWSATTRFKRLLNILINRGDISVQLGKPLPISEAAADDISNNLKARRTARLLRVRMRQQRNSVLGPDFSHRRTLVRQIVHSRQVQAAIARKAPEDRRARSKLTKKALKQAHTIASDLSYPTVRVLESMLTWFWNKIYDGVDFVNVDQLNELAQSHTLIYVPSHRSHLDYLLLSYLLFHRGLMIPHIAAGDNLNIPVLGSVLRRGGAFFMRRTFREDDVYRAVFDEYLYQVYRRGHSVEFFPEGGRTRTGRLLAAKTGLLRMTLAHHQRGLPQPIAFVPVYVGYEKLVEAASYLAELRGENKRGESIGDVFRSVRLIRQNFGRVSVNVGEPLLLDAWAQEHEDTASAESAATLGRELMVRVNQAADVNAINLVALATLDMPRLAIETQELAAQISCYKNLLSALGWPTTQLDGEACIEHAERLELVHRETEQYGEIVSLDANTAVLMTWYRNNVSHTLALPSLISCLLCSRRRALSLNGLQSMVDTVFPYLARELSMQPEQPDVAQTVRAMVDQGLLVERDNDGLLPPPTDTVEHHQLHLLSRVVMQNLERLYIVASLLTRASQSRRELLEKSQSAAQMLARIYGLNAPEFSDRKLFDQFVDQMLSRGAISSNADGRLEASELMHNVTNLARHVIPPEFQRAVLRVDTHQSVPSAP